MATGGQLIPLYVGRTATAVRGLPDCGAILRLSSGRVWIALLGLLLAGIVALNVATLSLNASAGQIEADHQTLRNENSGLRRRLAERLSNDKVQAAAAGMGLSSPNPQEITYRKADPDAVAAAAQRLASMPE